MATTWTGQVRRVLSSLLGSRPASRPGAPGPVPVPGPRSDRARAGGGVAAPPGRRPYPGDFTGIPAIHYAPKPDGLPDPGEVVWTWVPFEEDHHLGKDRPVLLVGSDGDWLLAVMLTSKDHDRDTAAQRRSGRVWVDVGAGGWDTTGRPSEVRVDRIIRVDPHGIRREGAVLAEAAFRMVAEGIRETH